MNSSRLRDPSTGRLVVMRCRPSFTTGLSNPTSFFLRNPTFSSISRPMCTDTKVDYLSVRARTVFRRCVSVRRDLYRVSNKGRKSYTAGVEISKRRGSVSGTTDGQTRP